MISLKSIQILQIIISILLMLSILLQNRGDGMGSAFGGGGGGGAYRTKRGAEKILFRATIILATIFIALGLLGLLTYNQ